MDKTYAKTTFHFNPVYILIGILIAFVANKASYLNLPYYWDEAWSYATAIFDMHKNGLAIIPGDGNVELTRGHPLLFYFLAAAWTKIFGTGLVAVHIFPLLISCILLLAVFLLTRELFDPFTALFSVILLSVQTEFFTQSTLLLPEVMLALWTILTLLAWFKRNWLLYVVFSTLLVMTKETGIILILILLFDKVILQRFFKDAPRKGRSFAMDEIILMGIPLFVFAGFMVIQKIRLGWFLFPDHVGMMVLEPHEALNRFRMFASKLLFTFGRNIFFFVMIAGSIYLILKKEISRKHAHYLILFLVFTGCYIVFSSVNFFTTRYLMSVLPLYLIGGIWLITSGIKNIWFKSAVSILLVLLFMFKTFNNRNESDISPAFKNTVLLHKQAINYAENMGFHDKQIYSTFLMQYNMTLPELGYLNGNRFLHVYGSPEGTYDVYIFCSNEGDPNYDRLKNDHHLVLLKRFEKQKAWVEIYRTPMD